MMSTEPHASNLKGKAFLQKAFQSEQRSLHSKLIASDSIIHSGDRGEVNEEFFIEFFRHYLPDRYTVEKAMVIDSEGSVSDSIDLVVFDRQYTPTLLDNDKHRYVPSEAVYAIFECKPTINKDYLEYAANKAESVRKLVRTSVPIPHAGGTYPAKEHFNIVSGLLAKEMGWADGFGEVFRSNHQEHVDDYLVDCGLSVSGNAFDIFNGDFAYSLCEGDNALIFFMFRFLNKLQSLGTVPAIDWNAYADQLSRFTQEEE